VRGEAAVERDAAAAATQAALRERLEQEYLDRHMGPAVEKMAERLGDAERQDAVRVLAHLLAPAWLLAGKAGQVEVRSRTVSDNCDTSFIVTFAPEFLPAVSASGFHALQRIKRACMSGASGFGCALRWHKSGLSVRAGCDVPALVRARCRQRHVPLPAEGAHGEAVP
jgi:hypothetical protein